MDLLDQVGPHSVGTDSDNGGMGAGGGSSIEGHEDETPEQKAEREKSRRQANNARER